MLNAENKILSIPLLYPVIYSMCLYLLSFIKNKYLILERTTPACQAIIRPKIVWIIWFKYAQFIYSKRFVL